jgi:hypothetical protein
MKCISVIISLLVFFALSGYPQVGRKNRNRNIVATKVQNVKGTVYYYALGTKKLLTVSEQIASDARFEVVDGVVEVLINAQLITATAGADFGVTHKPGYLKVTSNQGVPIEISMTSGHNLVLTSKAEVTILQSEGKLKISVNKRRALMSDLRGGQETRILNTSDSLLVTDLGIAHIQSRIEKKEKTAISELFKRFTKEEYELFSFHDTDLKDFVFAEDAFLNNRLVGKRNYLKYFLFLGGSYDSNIYLTSTGKRNAYISRDAVGFKFKQSFENSYVYGGYRVDLLKYSKDKSLNDAVYHDASGGFKIKFPGNFTVALKENYLATTEQENSEITFRTKRTQNDLKSFVEFPIKGKLGLRSYIKHLNHNYSSAALSGLDRTIFSAGSGFTYWFLPETLLYIHYQYDNLDYKNLTTHDCKYHTVGLSLERQLSPEVVGKVGAGFEFRNYDNDFVIAPFKAENKPTTLVFDAQVVWKPHASSRVIFIGERKNVETNTDGVFLNPASPVELSRYYESTLLDLSWLHKKGKFDFNLGFGWEFADYPQRNIAVSKKRQDRYSRFRAQVSWSVSRWFSVDAGYGFENRSSNIVANDYDAHEGSLGVKLVF